MTCKHRSITINYTVPFTRCWATHPSLRHYAEAHGGTTMKETCADCGATRMHNQNDGTRRNEYSRWRDPDEVRR